MASRENLQRFSTAASIARRSNGNNHQNPKMNSPSAEQATTQCHTCAAEIVYEPLMVGPVDLARSLHRHCERCTAESKAEADRLEKDAAIEKARGTLRAIIPPDLLDTDPRHEDFNAPLWSVVKMWSPTPRERSLGIIGPAAKCKTRVMALLAKRVVIKGDRIAWTSAVRLADAARDRNSRDRSISTIAREHLSECLNVPWLFLDDLGKNEWGPSFESQLFQILDHRIGYRLTTVWSANAHPEGFSQVISPLNAWPIIGRLVDRTTLLELQQ
jgi:DNA replication protein DnaC